MGKSKKRSKVMEYSESDSDEFDGMKSEEMNGQFYDDDDGEAEEEGLESDQEENEDEEEEEEEDVSDEDVEGGEEVNNEGDPNGGLDDAEMEDLQKQLDFLDQEQNMLRNLKRQKDEDVLKGQAVKNQKALWDKALEFRFLLQRAFSSSNRLPQEPVRSLFCDSNQEVKEAYANLITSSTKTLESLLELQEALVENNPSISQSFDGTLPSHIHSGDCNYGQSANLEMEGDKDSSNLEMEGDKEWLRIAQLHKRIAPFRDKSVDKWQRKTQVTTGAAAMKSKLQAFNQNVSDQVAAYMRDPSRMLRHMQLRKSTVGVFGAVPAVVNIDQGEGAPPDGDPELLDDSEFYQQLLKEFFETIDPTSSETAFYALKRMQTKKRKIVDRRASKSRKIRYNVHEKIVNFMAPQPMKLPAMAPKLFENLFGLKTPKASSVS